MSQSKKSALLPNGRDRARPIRRFEELFAQVYVSLVVHPAWRGLSSSAKDSFLLCIVKNGRAAKKGEKNYSGRPIFTFTYSEAQRLLAMPSPTFRRALVELISKGFLSVFRHGGISAGKGHSAMYSLSKAWEEWQPPLLGKKDMRKAREARRKRGS